jgi:hypothetical protein
MVKISLINKDMEKLCDQFTVLGWILPFSLFDFSKSSTFFLTKQ